ncbi:hypothetical protein HP934_002446 [Enterococcus faecalis]|nr:hypothetical protein [Enterococcus faecalis]
MTFCFRDLTIHPISEEKNLVIACDSSSGIGFKKNDIMQVSPEIMAAFCVRVPLLELICFGSEPKILVDVVGNEYHDTGKLMIRGIKGELHKAGFHEVILNGSTEENMETFTTSVGVTIIGEKKREYELPTFPSETTLLRLGIPYVGKEVVTHLETIFSYSLVKELYNREEVLDMLPVGSKGISYEAHQMAQYNQLSVEFTELDYLEESAGPATVVLLAVKANHTKDLLADFPMLTLIGAFK